MPSLAFSASSSAVDLYLKNFDMDDSWANPARKGSGSDTPAVLAGRVRQTNRLTFAIRWFAEQQYEHDHRQRVASQRHEPDATPVGGVSDAAQFDRVACQEVARQHGRSAADERDQ